jgi:hypothetical protein
MIALAIPMTSDTVLYLRALVHFFGCYITMKMGAVTTMLGQYNNIKVFENNIEPALNCRMKKKPKIFNNTFFI